MHILLTDRLSCPRCGPDFGLILLAERMEERRVYDGALGCPNCRDRFPVTDGFGDLRAPPRSELPPTDAPGGEGDAVGAAGTAEAGRDADEVTRLGALLGVGQGPGHLALVGPVARLAGGLADRLEDIEVVAVSAATRADAERVGVSRLVARPGLPFRTLSLRGVALSGDDVGRWIDEGARCVAAGGRVVVFGAPDDAVGRLGSAGLSPVFEEGAVVVASR